jgi:hypothetical protein
MPARSGKIEQKPTFIFKGTIKKLRSATMKDVPVNDRTAIVKVEEIIEAPAALLDYKGQDITVQISTRRKLKVGQEMIFHTTNCIFGDSIAVESIREEPVESEQAAMLSAASDPVERQAHRARREHFDTADVVVSGKVVSVRLPSVTAEEMGTSSADSDQVPGGPVSEHDPNWREAVVEVKEVHKGSPKKKQIIVRFPASTDVMWYSAPKFQPGQQGYFMLRKEKAKSSKTKRAKKSAGAKKSIEKSAAAAEAETKEVYTALNPADFQSYHEAGGIKTIIETESAKDKS